MAKAAPQAVTMGVFQWVVTGLLGAIVGLVVLVYAGVRSDIGRLDTSVNTVAREIVAAKLDTTKELGRIAKEAAITNTKLDALIDEMRRPK